MNTIANTQAASLNKAPAPTTEVQFAIQRIEALISRLESASFELTDKLSSVIYPSPPEEGSNAHACPSSPVPLARGLHQLADRVENLVTVHSNVIDRLHL